MVTHNGYNNFHYEYTPARQIVHLIPASIEVPRNCEVKFVKAIVMCKIGNGYGVAWAAEPFYDQLIEGFSDRHIFRFVDLLNDDEVRSRLQLRDCQRRLQSLSEQMEHRAVNAQLKQVLTYVRSIPSERLHQIHSDGRFQQYRRAIVSIR